MSYEAWRREVTNGTMPDWDEDKGDYGDAAPQGFRWCCYDMMTRNPPTAPHQHCANGHPLVWHDPHDPERGWFDCEDESGGRDE